MKPLVSVIVPIYNGKKDIQKCIAGLRSQTYENIEILLIDDGSRDGSSELCDEIAAGAPGIRVIHQANAGVSISRNTGIQKAKGTYLLFVDVDDEVTSELIEDNVNMALEDHSDVVMFCFQYFNVEKEQIIPNAMDVSFSGTAEVFFHTELIQTLDNEVFNAPWNKLILRSLLLENQIGFDPKYKIYEDMVFNAKLLQYAGHISLNPKIYYTYYFRASGTAITKFNSNFFDSVTQFYDNACEYCSFYADNQKQISKFSELYSKLIILHIKQICQNDSLGKDEKKELLNRMAENSKVRFAVAHSGISMRKKFMALLLQRRCYGVLKLIYRIRK